MMELSQDTWQARTLILSNSDNTEVKFVGFSELPILKVLFCDKIILLLIDGKSHSSLIIQKSAYNRNKSTVKTEFSPWPKWNNKA